MTELYDWFSFPHVVDVQCPVCAGHACFEFAEVVQIELKKDVPYFANSDVFYYQQFMDSCGHKWHAAVWYKGLERSDLGSVVDLPEGYSPKDWEHSRYLRSYDSWKFGTIICNDCHHRKKHELDWPKDARFKIEHRGKELWAFHRESMTDLLYFIDSVERKPREFKWGYMLRHVPKDFLGSKVRSAITKKIQKSLE